LKITSEMTARTRLSAYAPSMPVLTRFRIELLEDAMSKALEGDSASVLSELTLRKAMRLLDNIAAAVHRDDSDPRDDRVDRASVVLADARRTLILTTDRLYQAALYTLSQQHDATHANGKTRWQLQVDVGGRPCASAALALQSDGADDRSEFWPRNRAYLEWLDARVRAKELTLDDAVPPLPKRADPFDPGHEYDCYPKSTRWEHARADARTLMAAALLAQTLLPVRAGGNVKEYPDSVDVVFAGLEDAMVNEMKSVRALYQTFNGALTTLRADAATLSELVAVLSVFCVNGVV
jgi:hypothetical protein